MSSSQIAKLILYNLAALAELEIDLASSEMVNKRSRPTSDMHDEPNQRWTKLIKERSASEPCPYEYEKLQGEMLQPTLPRDKETDLKQLADGPWPLNVPSFHHWSSKSVKNPKRDAPKYALVALAEVIVVSDYRADLLKNSYAARFFRTEIRKLLNQDLKKKPQHGAGRARQDTGWNFPDGIQWRDQHCLATENVSALLQEHSCVHDAKGGAQEVMGLMKRIVKHPMTLMKPGDSAYAGMVAPEVDASLRQLFDVRREVAIGIVLILSFKCRY